MLGRKNRGKIEIMADILSLTTVRTIRKTHIINRVRLSYKQTLNYLEELQCNGLLEELEEEGTSVYKMTEKGREFLSLFANISSLMNGLEAKVYERQRIGSA